MILLVLTMGEGHGRIAITMAVFPFYIIGNYYALFPSSTIAKTLFSLERESSPLGNGIATTMMINCLNRLKYLGFETAELWVTNGNEAAHIYEKLGFKPSASAKEIFYYRKP